MKKHLVTSSAFNQVAYDKENKVLFIYFKHSPIYSFKEVPEDFFKEFMNAKSKGTFYHSRIKGKFLESRLDN